MRMKIGVARDDETFAEEYLGKERKEEECDTTKRTHVDPSDLPPLPPAVEFHSCSDNVLMESYLQSLMIFVKHAGRLLVQLRRVQRRRASGYIARTLSYAS